MKKQKRKRKGLGSEAQAGQEDWLVADAIWKSTDPEVKRFFSQVILEGTQLEQAIQRCVLKFHHLLPPSQQKRLAREAW